MFVRDTGAEINNAFKEFVGGLVIVLLVGAGELHQSRRLGQRFALAVLGQRQDESDPGKSDNVDVPLPRGLFGKLQDFFKSRDGQVVIAFARRILVGFVEAVMKFGCDHALAVFGVG